MALNFKVERSITNKDFIGSNMELQTHCDSFDQKYYSGALRDCLAEGREILESFVKYMYKRLLKKKDAPKQLGTILSNTNFKLAIDNPKWISDAGRINDITKKYHHAEPGKYETPEEFEDRIKYEDEKEVPTATKEVLSLFPSFLDFAATIINKKISSVRGEVKLSCEPLLNRKTGLVKPTIIARFSDIDDFDDYKNNRTWEIKGVGPIRPKGTSLIIDERDLGKVFVFTATNEKTGQVLTDEYGPIKEIDLLTGGKEDSTHPKLTTIYEPTGGKKPPQNEGKKKPSKPDTPKKDPLLTASFLEAELAKELLKTQEDYDAED